MQTATKFSVELQVITLSALLENHPQLVVIEMIIEISKYLIKSVSETWNVRDIQMLLNQVCMADGSK
ncbi:hypothetical protein AQUCO_00300435v1 [Aquilegia coerulea]|uniref:Uncharacterized protein n=1 Tax=Aquilegia coerulea TaxID=218851 RepID=A0A2G5EYV6_AQUCA|nr:hypothetical protein AQUCO_00300435v1 [Aquilegia coerulea]